MRSSIYIDISLLAVLFALHFTRNPKSQNFKLGVLILLFAHVVVTSSKTQKQTNKLDSLGMENENSESEPKEVTQEDSEVESKESVPDFLTDEEIENEPTNIITKKDVPTFRKSVSDSKFDRNFSVPSGSKILSSPNPVVSDDTNKRLADARTKFWSGLV